MSRPKVHTPGENLPPDHDNEGTDGDLAVQGAGAAADNDSALKAQIEALQRENALLRAAQNAKTPSVVYEPDTAHGKAEKAASLHLHLTAAEVAGAVARGEMADPKVKVLCRDGWYVPESRAKQG
jgi:hypothetical protein